MSFLLDTNVLSETMRRQPDLKVDAWVFQQKTIILSIVSVEEIYFGLMFRDTHEKLAWFEELVSTPPRAEILPVTPEIARQAGTLRARFRQQGITSSQADMLIAATAKHHGLTLATRNSRDFEGCGIELFNPFAE